MLSAYIPIAIFVAVATGFAVFTLAWSASSWRPARMLPDSPSSSPSYFRVRVLRTGCGPRRPVWTPGLRLSDRVVGALYPHPSRKAGHRVVAAPRRSGDAQSLTCRHRRGPPAEREKGERTTATWAISHTPRRTTLGHPRMITSDSATPPRGPDPVTGVSTVLVRAGGATWAAEVIVFTGDTWALAFRRDSSSSSTAQRQSARRSIQLGRDPGSAARKWVTGVRPQDGRKQLEPVHDTRPGAVEVARAIHSHDPPAAATGQVTKA